MEAAFTFVSTYGDEVKMAVRSGNHILVPRRVAPLGGHDKRVSRPLPAIDCKMPPLDVEQAGCISSSLKLLQNGVDHVLEAPTGFGKTYIGSAIAARLGQATLIVVPKQDLMDSWYKTLINLVGVTPDDIGIAQGAKLDYKGKRFVLGMVQSIIRPGKYEEDFYRSFGLVIFDETHRMAAECFSRACMLFPGMHRLGLSATPKRNDGKTPVISAHIGPVLVRGVTVPMSPKILVESTGCGLPSWMDNIDPGRMMAAYGALSKNTQRNEKIVGFTKNAYGKGRTIVLMSDLISHLNLLSNMLIQAGIPPTDIGMYTGEVQRVLLKPNANKRVILATYGMCSEGTDYPHWDTLIMVTPRANIKQPLGRILRKKAGKPTPVALDLVDSGRIFKGFYYKRLKQYHEVGSEVVQL
jgi:superfamily II DNA or RNA helicase